MSKTRNITINCNSCNKEFDVTIYDSINVTLNPELKEKFLSKKIYFFKCPYCGNTHYIPYPILYNDMEHNFMVLSADIGPIYNFVNTDLSFDDTFTNNNITMIGANTPILAIEKVVALENGLDHRIATIARTIVEAHYNEYAIENNLPESTRSYLGYNNNELCIIIDCFTNKQHNSYCNVFDMNLYNYIKEKFKDRLEGTCNWLFNDYVAYKILSIDDNRYEYERNTKLPIALVKDKYGNTSFATIPTIFVDEYNEGDNVIILNKDTITKVEIIKIITNMTLYELPFDYNNASKIIRKVSNTGLTTSQNSNKEIRNDKLYEYLARYKETNESFPYELVSKLDVVIAMYSTIDGNYDIVDENGNKLTDDISKANIGDYIKANIKLKPLTTNENDKHLLNVYLNSDDISNNDNSISKAIYNLDDVIHYVIDMSSIYEGIEIIYNDKKISLSNIFLINDYIPRRILSNTNHTIELLNNLTNKEKDYIGKKHLQYISSMLLDNKKLKDLSNEYSGDIKYVEIIIEEAYSRLFDIIRRKD